MATSEQLLVTIVTLLVTTATSEQLTTTHSFTSPTSSASYKPPDKIILFANTPAPEPGLFINPGNDNIYDIDTITSTEMLSTKMSKIVMVNNTTLSEEGPENMVVTMVTGDGFSGPADVALGCLVLVMCVVALTGNTWSMAYFMEKKKKSIHSLMYSFMSIIDITSSLISIPVIVTLFSSRVPVMFGNGAFCLIWTVLFYYLLRISIFLVLLISITRTMGMTFPVHRVKRSAVILSLGVYSAFILIIDIIYLAAGLLEIRYRKEDTFCEMFEPAGAQNHGPGRFYTILLKLELIVPSILVLVSFIVATVLLFKQMEGRRKMLKDDTELRFATVTVALFTATFLICNLPCFCIQLIYFTSLFHPDVQRNVRGNEGFKYYAHLITVFLLPLLNSSLNPCLYLTRMPQYRTWSSSRSIEIRIKGKRWTLLSAKSQSSVA